MAIELREFDAVPNPARRIVMHHLEAPDHGPLARFHTGLVMAPDIDQDLNANSGWIGEPPIAQIWREVSRVSDATFPQFDYDRNGHTAPDYLHQKVKRSIHNRLRPFGRCFQLLRDRRARAGCVDSALTGLIEDWGIRTMSDTVHRVTERLGGREQFLVRSSHEEFVRNRQVLVNAVRNDLESMRGAIDGVLFRLHPWQLSKEQLKQSLQELVAQNTRAGYIEVMAAFRRRRGS